MTLPECQRRFPDWLGNWLDQMPSDRLPTPRPSSLAPLFETDYWVGCTTVWPSTAVVYGKSWKHTPRYIFNAFLLFRYWIPIIIKYLIAQENWFIRMKANPVTHPHAVHSWGWRDHFRKLPFVSQVLGAQEEKRKMCYWQPWWVWGFTKSISDIYQSLVDWLAEEERGRLSFFVVVTDGVAIKMCNNRYQRVGTDVSPKL